MNTTNFNKPEKHPCGMLSGYRNASEKEGLLCFILSECTDAGEFKEVKTKYSHKSMVQDGLLEEVREKTYKLTKKSKGLLYSVYGK